MLFERLVVFATLALFATATPFNDLVSRSAPQASCSSTKLVDSSVVTVGGNSVVLSTLACDSSARVVEAAAQDTNTTDPVDVCGLICNTFCGSLGDLPPTTEDCQTIKDAIQIFAGNAAPTFVVQPSHIQQLTFGTCRFFFENLGSEPEEYCWQDLANTGSAAAAACFPPTNPVNSLASCKAPDGTWELGVSHSNTTDTSS